MSQLYLIYHTPRTGGTFLSTNLPHWHSRDNGEWLMSYNIDERYQEMHNDIPSITKRTKDQQQQLKFVIGHSLTRAFPLLLKTPKEVRNIFPSRHPIERLLSSFNFRHACSKLCQDDSIFNHISPSAGSSAQHGEKTYYDYDTLYEWYKDNPKEHNLQIRWLLKSFYQEDNNSAYEIQSFERNFLPYYTETFYIPEFLDSIYLANYLKDIAIKTIEEKIWWCPILDTLSKDTDDFVTEVLGKPVKDADKTIRNSSTEQIEPYWTLEDVYSQPDIEDLITCEKWDFEIWDASKNKSRPF